MDNKIKSFLIDGDCRFSTLNNKIFDMKGVGSGNFVKALESAAKTLNALSQATAVTLESGHVITRA